METQEGLIQELISAGPSTRIAPVASLSHPSQDSQERLEMATLDRAHTWDALPGLL